MTANPIILERIFDAPAEMVWRALTENDLIKQWYFPLAEFKAEKGFRFQFTGGPSKEKQYVHLCEITEVINGQRLSYTWAYEGYDGVSLLSFELFPEGDKTRLKLTHSGISSFPADNPDFAQHNFEKGWDHIINTALKGFLEKTPDLKKAGHPTSITKDLANRKLIITREFDAAPGRVWAAWTEAHLIDQWWAPKPWKAITKTMNFTPGGHWHYAMTGPDGEAIWCMVEFITIDPFKSFEMQSYFCDEDGNKDHAMPDMYWKNEFQATATGTKVLVENSFTQLAHMEKIIEMGFEGGFTMALGNLDALLLK